MIKLCVVKVLLDQQMRMSISVNRYVPEYVKKDLRWYERDVILTSLDRSKYEEFERGPYGYLAKAKLINFDIIYAEIEKRTTNLPVKYYQTVKNSDLKNFPKKEKSMAVSSCLRFSRNDIFVENNFKL